MIWFALMVFIVIGSAVGFTVWAVRAVVRKVRRVPTARQVAAAELERFSAQSRHLHELWLQEHRVGVIASPITD